MFGLNLIQVKNSMVWASLHLFWLSSDRFNYTPSVNAGTINDMDTTLYRLTTNKMIKKSTYFCRMWYILSKYFMFWYRLTLDGTFLRSLRNYLYGITRCIIKVGTLCMDYYSTPYLCLASMYCYSHTELSGASGTKCINKVWSREWTWSTYLCQHLNGNLD